jgi:hypothetical protein
MFGFILHAAITLRNDVVLFFYIAGNSPGLSAVNFPIAILDSRREML